MFTASKVKTCCQHSHKFMYGNYLLHILLIYIGTKPRRAWVPSANKTSARNHLDSVKQAMILKIMTFMIFELKTLHGEKQCILFFKR